MIKAAFAKICSGLLTGIGFAVAIAAVFFGIGRWEKSQASDQLAGFEMRQYKPDSGLIIKDHRPLTTDQNTAFIGTVENNGKDTWESVSIDVDLFDKGGQFVDKCSGYERGRIAPGQTHNFKASCGGCRDASVAQYDHYTIAIVDANYVRPSK